VIVIHVGNRARFDFEQIAGSGNIGQDICRGEIGRAGEAGIEMCGFDSHAPKRKIGKAGIELGLWMPRQKTPAQVRFVSRVTCNLCKPAEHGQPRMRERITLSGGSEQDRCATVRFKIGGMAGKPGYQDQRRPIAVGCDIDERADRMSGVAVDRRERAGADRAQQVFAIDLASNSGLGAVSGSRSGMAPGSGRSGFVRFAISGRLDSVIAALLGAPGTTGGYWGLYLSGSSPVPIRSI